MCLELRSITIYILGLGIAMGARDMRPDLGIVSCFFNFLV